MMGLAITPAKNMEIAALYHMLIFMKRNKKYITQPTMIPVTADGNPRGKNQSETGVIFSIKYKYGKTESVNTHGQRTLPYLLISKEETAIHPKGIDKSG